MQLGFDRDSLSTILFFYSFIILIRTDSFTGILLNAAIFLEMFLRTLYDVEIFSNTPSLLYSDFASLVFPPLGQVIQEVFQNDAKFF